MNEIVTINAGDIMEQVIIRGDLSKLSPSERADYYKVVCESLGLNPLTNPFGYIVLNGKLQLYAKKDATEQLRKIHKVSITKLEKETIDGVFCVTAYAIDGTGRKDVDMGAVNINGLKGEAYANAHMKAITKAKRRVTLSICGLGMLDESEADSIPNAVIIESESPVEAPKSQQGPSVVENAPETPYAPNEPLPDPRYENWESIESLGKQLFGDEWVAQRNQMVKAIARSARSWKDLGLDQMGKIWQELEEINKQATTPDM